MSAAPQLQAPPAPADLTPERVAESLVVRGDISSLNAGERVQYYIRTCERLGLDPYSAPLAVLRLNGKDILYPHRGATDQMAAHARLNRRIIRGPEIVDIAGVKVAMAVCEATHPDGRVETATATLPIGDHATLYMKLETKAKRRATLSILGLGMLDESELDAIDVRQLAPAPPIQLPGGQVVHHQLPDGIRVPETQTVETRERAPAPAGPRPAPVPASTAAAPEQPRDWLARIVKATQQERPWRALMFVGGELVAADLGARRDATLAAWAAEVVKRVATIPDRPALEGAKTSLEPLTESLLQHLPDQSAIDLETAFKARAKALGITVKGDEEAREPGAEG